MGSLLQVRNLKICYRLRSGQFFTAVDDVSLDLRAAETVGLMGESGCGKSSVALASLGLLPKKQSDISGSVQFEERDLLTLDEPSLQKVRGAAISIIHQEPTLALSPLIVVGEQVAEVIHAHRKWSWKKCRAEARGMFNRVGLEDTDRTFQAYPHQLSGGQCQRVVLAQALACGPKLLIADEPTAHLDARSQLDFLSLLAEMKKQTGISLLLISHSPEVQASLADRILVMRAGRIIEEGRYNDLCRRALHPYTLTLMGLAPPTREPREPTTKTFPQPEWAQ